MLSAWSLVADGILLVMLAGTLVMALRLDKALRIVRRDRAAFETLISNLGSATNAVGLGIQALRGEADRAAEQIGRRSEDADKMATDLSFLIEAADRAGARMEQRLQALQGQVVEPPAEADPVAPPPALATTSTSAPTSTSKTGSAGRSMKRQRPTPPAPPNEAPNIGPAAVPVLEIDPVPAEASTGLRELAGITTRAGIRGAGALTTSRAQSGLMKLVK